MPDKAKPILAAVDFSPFSERALLWAARAARSFDAPLVALHVVHDPSSAPGYYQHEKKRKKHLQRIEEAASERMSEFLVRLRKKNPELLGEMKPMLVIGLPVTRILEVAEKIDARMIVMGSRGRTGLAHLLLGSKAERVVPKMQATLEFVSGYVRQQVKQLDLTPPVSFAMQATLIPSDSLDRVAHTRAWTTFAHGQPRGL